MKLKLQASAICHLPCCHLLFSHPGPNPLILLILSETLCAHPLASLSRRLPRAFHFVLCCLCCLPIEHRLPLSLTWSSSLSFGLGMISAKITAAGPATPA